MLKRTIIKNSILVNEGKSFESDLLICEGRIERIDRDISHPEAYIIEADGLNLIPGCIDDQVHFRDPGLTHKADIATESRAAVAGGITSFMEMPNTIPNTLTKALLEAKYLIAEKKSVANYSFYMGVSRDNLDEILSVNYSNVCGIKVFMGSSTGGMLVDDPHILESLFSKAPTLIATHCEDEKTIKHNLAIFEKQFHGNLTADQHPNIRSREACLLSSSFAVSLAKKHSTRLHILHISTADELSLFENKTALADKKITSEACVHHLFFDNTSYATLRNKIKCNPAIKTTEDRKALCLGLTDGILDVVATDHAPHTLDEKSQPYLSAPSGLPLVQHALPMMITLGVENHWDLPFIVQKMAHNPAICFQIANRGFLREGYFADLVILNPHQVQNIKAAQLYYKCGWSPLETYDLKGKVVKTFVNGHLVYDNDHIVAEHTGMRMNFDRK